jgi:hypothetical protein
MILIFLFVVSKASSKVYYIAPDGNDLNDGSMEAPIASADRAQDLVSAGDTVYFRGGIYQLSDSDISYVHSGLFACYAFIDKSGTSGNRINYWAYPGEQPVLDFTDVKPAGQRVVGFYVTANYIHFKGLEITGVQVTITDHTESYCFYNYGSYNIFELLKMHDGQATGIRHRKGGHNLFLNCDSYRNHDYTSENGKGGNTDGFGCHPDAGGEGNVFRGCRAWFNSDDGYDFIGSAEVVTIENCWALYNGYSPSFQSLADGNGFKAGGDAVTPVDQLPNPIPRHVVRFCVAVKNKASGFYANHHIGGINWFNNSAYNNSVNYNMLNRLDDNETDVPGYGHKLYNNLGYAGGAELRNINLDLCDLQNNYFYFDVEVNEDDFKSLLRSQLIGPRSEDGSLPEVDFMHLTRGSDLVDRGKDIGFDFEGYAPDLGAFEQGYFAFPQREAYWYQKYTPEYYWEEGKEAHTRVFGLLWEDQAIDGKTYHSLYEFTDEALHPELAVYAGAIREDSLRRVYYRGTALYPQAASDTAEILLYDFFANVGDTIQQNILPGQEELIVSLVDSVQIGGEMRPRIHFSNDPYTKWIEGVGAERGLLFYADNILEHGLWSDLVCFFRDGEQLYHNEDYELCYEQPDGIANRSGEPGLFSFYPNPVSEVLTLEFSQPFSGSLRVYDLKGKLCLERELKNQLHSEIKLGALAEGVYVLQVFNPGYTHSGLIIRQD